MTRQKAVYANAKKNVALVSGSKIKDPNKTQQERADELGISQRTVSRAEKKLAEGVLSIDKTPDVVRIAKKDIEHVEKGQELIDMHFAKYKSDAEGGEHLNAGELNHVASIIDKGQKRASFLRGANSDKDGNERPLEGFSTEELRKIADL